MLTMEALQPLLAEVPANPPVRTSDTALMLDALHKLVATKSQSRHGKSCKHCPICVYVGARPMFIPYVDIHCDDLVKIALVSLQASHRIVNKFDSLQTQLLCGIFSCRHMGLIIFSRCTYEVR